MGNKKGGIGLDNLKKSELVIARVLSLLMDWGIQDTELRFEELDLNDDYRSFFFPCVNWLVEEDIIRTGKIQPFLDGPGAGVILRPVLTARGVSLLDMELKLGGENKSFAVAVKDVSTGNATYAKAGNFTGGLLASFIKSMS